MALPNFQICYWAANIKSLLYWRWDTSSKDLPGWLQIESSSCRPVSLLALLCSSIPLPSPQACQNPVVCYSLKIWCQFRKHYGLASMSVYSPVTANHLFPASLLDDAFNLWQKNRVLNIEMLYRDGIFMSFDQVREKFSLPAHNFFRYLQVRHFIKNHFTRFPQYHQSHHLILFLKLHLR